MISINYIYTCNVIKISKQSFTDDKIIHKNMYLRKKELVLFCQIISLQRSNPLKLNLITLYPRDSWKKLIARGNHLSRLNRKVANHWRGRCARAPRTPWLSLISDPRGRRMPVAASCSLDPRSPRSTLRSSDHRDPFSSSRRTFSLIQPVRTTPWTLPVFAILRKPSSWEKSCRVFG